MARLDPVDEYLSSISSHGANSIEGMNSVFKYRLFRMINDLPPEVKSRMNVISGYRSDEEQQTLWNQALQKYGSVQEARKWVAPPGSSEHNKGYAADLGFGGSGLSNAPSQVISYLHGVAPKYGLVFPLSNENWHIELAGARDNNLSSVQSAVARIGNGSTRGLDSGNDQVTGPYADLVKEAAAKYNIDPNLLYRQMMKESGGNPHAVSPAGALGLSQFMPETAKRFGLADRTDPAASLMAQGAYMRTLMDRYGGNTAKALAAYNAGEGNVDKANTLADLPAETQGYVRDILGGMSPASAEPVDQGDQSNPLGSAVAGVADVALQRPVSMLKSLTAGAEYIANKAVAPAAKVLGFDIGPDTTDATAQIQKLEDQAGGVATDVGSALSGQPLSSTPTFLDDLVRKTTSGGLGGAAGGALFGGPVVGGVLGAGAGAKAALDTFIAKNRVDTGFQPTPGANYVPGAQTRAMSAISGAPPSPVLKPPGTMDLIGQQPAKELPPAAAGAAAGVENASDPSWQAFIASGQEEQKTKAAVADLAPKSDFAGGPFDLTSLAAGANFIQQAIVSPAEAADRMATGNFTGLARDLAKPAWELYGPMAMVESAFLGAPYVVKAFTSRMPLRVTDLPPEVAPVIKGQQTQSIISRGLSGDRLSGMFVNFWDIVNRGLARAQVSPSMLKDMQQAQETAAGSIALTHSFFKTGEFHSPVGDMVITGDPMKQAIGSIQAAAKANPNVIPYINELRTLDDFSNLKGSLIAGRDIKAVQQAIADFERVDPSLLDIKKAMQSNVQAYWQFLKDTHFIDGKSVTKNITNRPNSLEPKSTGSMSRNVAFPSGTDPNGLDELVAHITYGTRNGFDNMLKRQIILSASTAVDKSGQPIRLFQPMTKVQRNAYIKNAGSAANEGSIVTVKHDGKDRHFATDPAWGSVMTNTPYHTYNVVAGALNGLKRYTEAIHTGIGAPEQTVASFARAVTQQRLTKPPGFKTVGTFRSLAAIPRIAGPEFALAMSRRLKASLDAGVNWLPDNISKGLADYAENVYNQSWAKMLDQGGGNFSNQYMQDVAARNYALGKATFKNMPKTVLQTTGDAFDSLINLMYMVRGAPEAAFKMRNLGILNKQGKLTWDAAHDVISAGTNVTGNLRMRGAYTMTNPRGISTPIPLSKDSWDITNRALQTAGVISDYIRGSSPWYNVQVQSMRNIFKSYWDDPLRFMLRAHAYIVAPTIANYFWNHHLGDEYSKYQMEGRTDQKSINNWYTALPGKHPSLGMDWPIPQEMGIIVRPLEYALDRAVRGDKGSPITNRDNALRTLWQYLGNTILPAAPVPFNTGATNPVQMAWDRVSEELGSKSAKMQKHFSQPGDVPDAWTSMASDYGGAMVNAFIHAASVAYHDYQDHGAVTSALGSGANEFGYRMAQATPGVRTLAGIPYRSAIRTPINIARDRKQAAIDSLINDYVTTAQYEMQGQTPVIPGPSNKGRVAIENEGDPEAYRYLPDPTMSREGMPYYAPQRQVPANPLYYEMLQRVMAEFSTNRTAKLAVIPFQTSFPAEMEQYRHLVRAYTNARTAIDSGNVTNWYERNKDNPDFQDILKGLSPTSRKVPDLVLAKVAEKLNYFDTHMYTTITRVEAAMSQIYNKKVRLEDIAPY